MFSTSQRMSHGPLAPFMHGDGGRHVSEYAHQGREAFMQQARDVEHWMEDNATTVCIAGVLLGTFVDRRFLLLPLALGGMMLWRSLQSSQ